MQNLEYRTFAEIDINDPFFDSLKADYQFGFMDWWGAKKSESAYVLYNDYGSIEGFMYLKIEEESITDTVPNLPYKRYLKIGTFKLEAIGTLRGQRFIKKAFDFAFAHQVSAIYTTVFSKHEGLIKLLESYGFYNVGIKSSMNGQENVYLKDLLGALSGNIYHDYPRVNAIGNNKYILSIYPEYHTRMFPDSRLANEKYLELEDVSYTNSIHKIYICAMEGVLAFRPGDLVVIYRTGDGRGPAHHRSVVTSVGTVEEVRSIDSFLDLNDFLNYTLRFSIFSQAELEGIFKTRKYPYIIKFMYNAALPKRLNRAYLLDQLGMDARAYWGCLKLTDDEFLQIIKGSGINESLIVD